MNKFKYTNGDPFKCPYCGDGVILATAEVKIHNAPVVHDGQGGFEIDWEGSKEYGKQGFPSYECNTCGVSIHHPLDEMREFEVTLAAHAVVKQESRTVKAQTLKCAEARAIDECGNFLWVYDGVIDDSHIAEVEELKT